MKTKNCPLHKNENKIKLENCVCETLCPQQLWNKMSKLYKGITNKINPIFFKSKSGDLHIIPNKIMQV